MTDVALNPRFEPSKECYRNYYPIFDRVEGRIEDFIVTPKGALITPAIITRPFKDLKTIKNAQIIQKSTETKAQLLDFNYNYFKGRHYGYKNKAGIIAEREIELEDKNKII